LETIRAVRAGGAGRSRIARVALRSPGAVRAVGTTITLAALRASRSNIAGVALRRLRRNTVLDTRQTSRRQRSLRIPITRLLFRVRHDQSSLSGATGKLIRPGKSAFPRNGQPSPDASPEPS